MDPKIKFLQDEKRKKAGKYVPINVWNSNREIPNQNPPEENPAIENDESAPLEPPADFTNYRDDFFDD